MITSKVINPYAEQNEKFYNILNYALIKKDFEGVKTIVSNVGAYTGDAKVQKRISDLFIASPKCNDWFGISEAINQTTVNMAFSGNVNIKINNNENANKLVDEFIYDSNFIETIKEAYSCALSCSGEAVSYIVFRTQSEINLNTMKKLGDRFVDFEVLKSYEMTKTKNKYIREFYKSVIVVNGNREEKKNYKFVYTYEIINKAKTILTIKGYLENSEISHNETMYVLQIDDVYEEFDFIPIFELRLGRGQLPNAIYIESRLAENLYFKGTDVQNSQTRKYVPEQMLYENSKPMNQTVAPLIDDPYKTTIPLRASIDRGGIVFQQGYSAIKELEQHLKLDILEACLDAKISPISLGFSLLDSLANNTDNPITKERVSIRLRETHVAILKMFIAKIVKTFLQINSFDIDVTDIAVIFDQYITPSIETLTNVLAKQVQFGIKSIEQAVRDLNKNEMSDEEIAKEVERIREQRVQMDYNMTQRNENEKQVQKENEEDNSEEPNLKENNVLKSSGVEE